jgi:hypothetical protein
MREATSVAGGTLATPSLMNRNALPHIKLKASSKPQSRALCAGMSFIRETMRAAPACCPQWSSVSRMSCAT